MDEVRATELGVGGAPASPRHVAVVSPRSRAANSALPGEWVPRRPPIVLRKAPRPSTRLAAYDAAFAEAEADERRRACRVAAKRAAQGAALVVIGKAAVLAKLAADKVAIACGTTTPLGPVHPPRVNLGGRPCPVRLAAPPAHAVKYSKVSGKTVACAPLHDDAPPSCTTTRHCTDALTPKIQAVALELHKNTRHCTAMPPKYKAVH